MGARNPLLRARPVPKKAGLAMSAKLGLPGSKFYYNLEGEIFAARKKVQQEKERKAGIRSISIFKKKVKGFEAAATGDFRESPRFLEILLVTCVNRRKGRGLFRIFLNEAIRMAKGRVIVINAGNKRLRSYYGQFGFVFNDEKVPLRGFLKT